MSEFEGLYFHIGTGNHYRVLCIAKENDSLEERVVYEAITGHNAGQFWVRDKHSFRERFRPVVPPAQPAVASGLVKVEELDGG